jgi:hypothetical protein
MRAYPLDVLQPRHASHQVLVDAQLHLAADLQRRTQEHVQRVVDRAFGGILHGHDTEIRMAGLHFGEYFVDLRKRQRAHRMTELLEHGLLRERAFGPEEAHLQRFLLCQAGRHDFPKQARHFFIAQWPLVALQDLA